MFCYLVTVVQVNPQVSGMVDIFGAFDNLIQPMFPFPMANLSIVLTFSDLRTETTDLSSTWMIFLSKNLRLNTNS